MPSKTVLVALPEEWAAETCRFLENEGYPALSAYSYENALMAIQSQQIFSVVMISEWAIQQDDGSPGLMKFLKGKIATYSLISQTTWKYHRKDWFDELYEPPRHEYRSMPFELKPLLLFLKSLHK
jgi:hypothetical protein